MASILYGVPYEVRVLGHQISSGRRVGTRHYLVNLIQTVAPPAYGAPIVGPSSTATLLGNFKTAWDVLFNAQMSVDAAMDSLEMRSILGRQYTTPLSSIASLGITLTDVHVVTATPHGFTTGNTVSITGVTTPAVVNGIWTIIRINNNEFTIPLVTPVVAYTGPGLTQKVAGSQQFSYGSKDIVADTTLGGVAGGSVAVFADASIVRNNTGIGKSFRSRFSMAPIAESQVSDGVFEGAAITSWGTALGTFFANFLNGGSDVPGSGQSIAVAVSQKKAFQQPTPFVTNNGWQAPVTSYHLHHNMGSQVKRKVRQLG